MIKAVLFDLDDTLYRERDFVDQAFGRVAAVMEKHLAEKKGAEAKSAEELFRQMIELMEKEGRGSIFDKLCEWHHMDILPQEFLNIYRETKPVLSLYPDAEIFLEHLQKEHIKTGLITDGNTKVQHHKIQALGLEKKLDIVLASDDLGLQKPDAGVYTYCLEKVSCKPQEAVYIGDNPLKDFIGARKLGMKTVRIIRPEGLHMRRIAQEGYEADKIVHLLTEVTLEQW